MDKKILNKVKRLVELSYKFSKSENDIFDCEPTLTCNGVKHGGDVHLDYKSVKISGDLYLNDKIVTTDAKGNLKAETPRKPTRADNILAKANAIAKLSDEFDEYNKLREDLNDYFKSLNKLID